MPPPAGRRRRSRSLIALPLRTGVNVGKHDISGFGFETLGQRATHTYCRVGAATTRPTQPHPDGVEPASILVDRTKSVDRQSELFGPSVDEGRLAVELPRDAHHVPAKAPEEG